MYKLLFCLINLLATSVTLFISGALNGDGEGVFFFGGGDFLFIGTAMSISPSSRTPGLKVYPGIGTGVGNPL
jgi:hypothetical protein